MAEKMLVTQALDERDLLVKKISDKIEKACFVDTIKPNEDRSYEERITREEFTKQAESAFQQINDLIARFGRIEAAIVASNASTRIITSFGEFTVAGAIALRSRLRDRDVYEGNADFESVMLEKMRDEYQRRVQFAEAKNRQLQTTAENMRLSILGKDTKVKDDKPLEVVEAYVRENTTELLDPLDIQKKIDSLREKRDTLLSELDTRIKVSNATTFIEI